MKVYIRSHSGTELPVERGIHDTSVRTSISGMSFDFTWDIDYDRREIESIIYRVFEDEFGMEVLGIDFHSVDYSDYPEFADTNVSQVSLDFRWVGDNYDNQAICEAIDAEMISRGYEVIGHDFYSL